MKKRWRLIASLCALCIIVIGSTLVISMKLAAASTLQTGSNNSKTATPIQHVVVIFDENISFDHYFGTYPVATNPHGEPAFYARPNTPSVNGLTPELRTNNPNTANPVRLDHSQALTCDQDHGYTDEQKAYDNGLVDKFTQFTEGTSCTDKSIVMDYYDGNTVTALWNYAQQYALNDNSFGTVFGPSTPGALNLISGRTHGVVASTPLSSVINGTLIGDADPLFDDCSTTGTNKVSMSGTNIGDLLNKQNVTWGWFEGGFRPTTITNGVAACNSTHTNIGGASITDYIPHHQPFQYYQSTANPHHLPPSSAQNIGKTDQANHQYDMQDFWTSIQHGNMPAVSFLKAPAYQDGHAGYSDPLDEQNFLVNTINRLQKSPDWKNTAVVVSYDDSDGWYDHVMPPIISMSTSEADALTGPGTCGVAKTGAYLDRCGYGPRLPLMVISPFARTNFVDDTLTDQSSILRFIEDNWKTGQLGDQSFDALAGPLTAMFNFQNHGSNRTLLLNPSTGEPTNH